MKQLEESKKRAEFQVRRIYRTRNLLFHAGEPVSYLHHLIENLEYYFSLTLLRIIHDLVKNPQWCIEDALEYRRMLFELMLRKAGRGHPSDLKVGDVLQGEGPLASELLW
ncbi:MAG: hypothetical protein ACLGJB_10825 [Blastocatellia bacterium]